MSKAGPGAGGSWEHRYARRNGSELLNHHPAKLGQDFVAHRGHMFLTRLLVPSLAIMFSGCMREGYQTQCCGQKAQCAYPVTRFEKSDEEAKRTLIAELAGRRDYVGLEAIAFSGHEGAENAAYELVSILEPKEAVAFCTRNEMHAEVWTSAIWALASHRKEDVISYFERCVNLDNARAKWFAYKVCYMADWPELAAYAILDTENDVRVAIWNQSPDERTIGQIAKKYYWKTLKRRANQSFGEVAGLDPD